MAGQVPCPDLPAPPCPARPFPSCYLPTTPPACQQPSCLCRRFEDAYALLTWLAEQYTDVPADTSYPEGVVLGWIPDGTLVAGEEVPSPLVVDDGDGTDSGS